MEALGRSDVQAYEKRDDLSSPLYGGNKVRTLEPLFGRALDDGASHVYSTGAYGSNHAAAAAMHAPRVGLTPGVVLYPQPFSQAALENLELVLSHRLPTRDLPHWSALPLGMWLTERDCRRRGIHAHVMVPGGATPHGALGYVSAGIELAMQVEQGDLPRPQQVVVAAGSNCTSAGLLVGFALAAQAGLGFIDRGQPAPPTLVSVRVTPWPITTPWRIIGLAHRASHLLARLAQQPSLALTRSALRSHFRLECAFLGSGYGFPTDAGREAMRLWQEHAGHPLEPTYSGKSAAAFLTLARTLPSGVIVYWSTKSSAYLEPVSAAALQWAPPRMRRWMESVRRQHASPLR